MRCSHFRRGDEERRHDYWGGTLLMNHRTVRLPRRVITFVAACGLATTGAAALATGWSATASPGDGHQVWVCAYVGPKSDQVLKPGKNPLLVDEAALEGGTFRGSGDEAVIIRVGGEDPGSAACSPVTPPAPTTTAIRTTDTPVVTETTTTVPTTTVPTTTVPVVTETTTVPTTTVPTTMVPVVVETTTTLPTTTVPTTVVPTTMVPVVVETTTTVPTTTVPVVTAPTTTAPTTTAPTALAGAGSGVVPGVSAPHTGGNGEARSGNRLLGSGLLASGLALAVGELARRRRGNATD